jgi:hypothetical protein
MKIELTMTELMLIVDMIKNGTEQDNEGAGDDAFIQGEIRPEFAKKGLTTRYIRCGRYLHSKNATILQSQCSRKRKRLLRMQ